MKVWGLALFFLLALSLPVVCQQEQAASPNPPAQANSSPAASEHAAAADPDPKLDLTPDAEGKLSQDQMQRLFRVVADKDMDNEKRVRDYTYVERDVQKNLDGRGHAKSTEVRTYDVLELYDEQVQRLIEKDDKPLEPKEAAKEEEKIQKIIDKRKNESEEERRKRAEKEEKDREEGRKFVTEIADAFIFKLVGTEQVSGREAWVIDGEPRPGFEPHMKGAKFLTKFRGRVWIDKADLQMAKMDIEAIDTVALGWFIARVHRGTRVMLEQTRVNDEVWLPRHVTFKLDARVALLKGYNIEGELMYRDYKKFRTSSKIIGVGQIEDPKGEPQK